MQIKVMIRYSIIAWFWALPLVGLCQEKGKFHLNLNGSYSFGIANANLPLFRYISSPYKLNPVGAEIYSSSVQDSGSWAAYMGSYGNGGAINLDAGYSVGESWGVGLGFSYAWSTPMRVSLYSEYSGNFNTGETTFQSEMFKVIPNLFMSFGQRKIRPFARAGLIIGLAGRIDYSTEWFYEANTPAGTFQDKVRHHWVQNGGVSLGFYGAVGVKYSVLDFLSISFELPITVQSYSPTTGKLTMYEVDDIDRLVSLPAHLREISYVDQLAHPQGNSTGDKLEQEKVWHPFSSVGFSIGVEFSIKGATRKENANSKD